MKIARLEIQGFKSFADKVSLRFGSGVTGVVGPNGCGKSNVVDALRWVMGEQSAKTIRGSKMSDVIFSGSAARGPMGMAEVSVYFENDGKGVPAEYSQYAEIQVTRRLYRDGDSDYEINRTPCRLRDIHELFMGTGIGTKAYSIIGQGQVSTLVKARAEDRRRIIEEAAGITKYKARKQVAVRKMEATRQNLLRVSDVTREITRRLGSLKRQANKAARYKELKAQVRDIELHQAALRYLELTTALQYEGSLSHGLRDEISADASKIEELEKRAETERLGLLDEDERLQKLQARLYELDNAAALSQQKVDQAKISLTEGEERRIQDAGEIEGLQEAIAMIRSKKEELQQGEAELDDESESHMSVLESAEATLNELKEKRTQGGDQSAHIRKLMLEAVGTAAQCEGDIQNLEVRLQDFDARKTVLMDDAELEQMAIEELKTQTQKFEAEQSDAIAQKADAERLKIEKAAALEDVSELVSELESKVSTGKDALSEVKNRLGSLRELSEGYARSPEGVRALMQRADEQKDPNTLGLFADLFVADQSVELAVEAAGRDLLQTVVVKDENAAVKALNYLRGDGESGTRGWARVLIASQAQAAGDVRLEGATRLLDSLEIPAENKDVVSALLGRTFIVEDSAKASALLGKAQAESITLVTARGEVFFPNGLVRGGDDKAADSGLLKQKREMRELEEKFEAQSEALEADTEAFEHAKNKKLELTQSIEAIASQLHQLEIIEVERKQELLKHHDDITRRNARHDQIMSETRTLAEDQERVKADLEAKSEKLELALVQREETEAQLLDAEGAQSALDAELGIAGERVTALKIKAVSQKERRENLRQSLEHHQRNEQDVRARLERLTLSITEIDGKKDELMQLIENESETALVATADRATLKEALDGDRKAYEEAAKLVREYEAEARSARQRVDAQRQSQAERDVRINELNYEFKALNERTQTHHGRLPHEVVHDYHLMPRPDAELLGDLEELRRKVNSMGEINLTAIEEYDELDERYQFLKEQSDDLTHALAQLEKAIVKINRTTKKRFLEAFEAINEHFQKVFPRLFRGGKAWLALTDKNDLLETGVEIYAQPPGKKLQSVNLMSGGEQALTAVSLIFAIFLIKPSPFCLLDEVDAPLDESNVGRFNDMIKDVSKISQFIVITHNKKTMEQADQLYGITMEEPGISKTVNVRMSS